MPRYLVTRYSSPYEWSIQSIPDDVPLGMFEQEPGGVFKTFTEAKAWLQDQTSAWARGFLDDLAEIRALRKGDVAATEPGGDAFALQEQRQTRINSARIEHHQLESVENETRAKA